jgi:hypothetical protein
MNWGVTNMVERQDHENAMIILVMTSEDVGQVKLTLIMVIMAIYYLAVYTALL